MWSIAVLVNEVEISDACAKELFEACGDGYRYGADEVCYKGRLNFNPDHNEHMDYVSDEKVRDVLTKHKVRGDICFGSVEGDNKGSFWGYRFDGQGGMEFLEGTVIWKVLRLPLKDKTIVITGTLKSMSRREVRGAIIAAGGSVSETVSKKTDYLVVGADPGSKLKRAQQPGVTILTEEQLLELLR